MTLRKDKFTNSMESRASSKEVVVEVVVVVVLAGAALHSSREDVEEGSASLKQMTSSNDSLVAEIPSQTSSTMTSLI